MLIHEHQIRNAEPHHDEDRAAGRRGADPPLRRADAGRHEGLRADVRALIEKGRPLIASIEQTITVPVGGKGLAA